MKIKMSILKKHEELKLDDTDGIVDVSSSILKK